MRPPDGSKLLLDEADRQVTLDDITNEPHKTIAQISHTTESHGIG